MLSGYSEQSGSDQDQNDKQNDRHEKIAPEGKDDRRKTICFSEVTHKDGRGGKDHSAQQSDRITLFRCFFG